MEFGPGFWGPIIATAAILLITGVVYLILVAARRVAAPRPSAQKLATYACGEELKPEEIHSDSEQYFSPVRRVLRPFYRYIQPAHTGALNTYLLWLILGFIIILVIILLTVK